MILFILPHAATLLAILAITAKATPNVLVLCENLEEHVGLYNCKSETTGLKESHVAYFSGNPDAFPDEWEYVSTPNGEWHVWEGGNDQKVTFSTGVTFSWNIDHRCPIDGLYVGSGNNGFAQLQCYYNATGGSYTAHPPSSSTLGPTLCERQYLCDHSVTTGQTCTQTRYSFGASKDYVELPLSWEMSAPDMLSKVLDLVSVESGIQDISSGQIDLGKNVFISFEGHGAVPGKTLYVAARIMAETMGHADGISKQWQTDETSCQAYCASGVCCDWENIVHHHTSMPSSGTVNLDNAAIDSNGQNTGDSSVQGYLKFTIQYVPPAEDCEAFNWLKKGLGAGAAIPEVGLLLGPLAAAANIVGGFFGCM